MWLFNFIDSIKRRRMAKKEAETIEKAIKSLSEEELFETLRTVSIYSALHGTLDEASWTIQKIIEEIRSKPARRPRLVDELSDLCLNGFMRPIYVLVEFFILEISNNKDYLGLREKILHNNLRNWIKYTYTTRLDPELSELITEEDVDHLELVILNVCARLNPQ